MTRHPRKATARPRRGDGTWVRLPDTTRRVVNALALAEDRPVSTMARVLIEEAVRARFGASMLEMLSTDVRAVAEEWRASNGAAKKE